MDFEKASAASRTDWIQVKQVSSFLFTEWHISALTEKASSHLMKEEYESLYKIVKLSLYRHDGKEPVTYDYPIHSSAGKKKLFFPKGFSAFQLHLILINSSNLKLFAAKTPDLPSARTDVLGDFLNADYRLYFSAYTDYGERD
ncbi:hypothetical protein [Metabacillus sp. 84]|uniref:hypothetical protein n=1 Tax=unclassified Metabacillus TaxID=2675274 RepID=UPI003CE970D6